MAQQSSVDKFFDAVDNAYDVVLDTLKAGVDRGYRVSKQLMHQPTQETRNRKKLRPNRVAEWELRVDKFRIFYDLDEAGEVVKIEAVGYKKGSRLFIHGEEYSL